MSPAYGRTRFKQAQKLSLPKPCQLSALVILFWHARNRWPCAEKRACSIWWRVRQCEGPRGLLGRMSADVLAHAQTCLYHTRVHINMQALARLNAHRWQLRRPRRQRMPWRRPVTCRARPQKPDSQSPPPANDAAPLSAPCGLAQALALWQEAQLCQCCSTYNVLRLLCRPIVVTMRVDEGETLESLAKKYGLPLSKLVAANGGAPPHKFASASRKAHVLALLLLPAAFTLSRTARHASARLAPCASP